MHPPLARVIAALGLYIDGYHTQGEADVYAEGTAILNQRGDPRGAIAIARAGILPFLLLAILVVFAWARSLAGDVAGLLAVLAFTCVPPVLAHSGLVTTDAAAMATIGAALFALVRWLEGPSTGATCLLGVCFGLALLAKMSALAFLPAVGTVLLFTWVAGGGRLLPYTRRAGIACAITFLVVWAGYRFSIGPIFPEHEAAVVSAHAGLVVPAPEFPRGFVQMLGENFKGRRSYLLGAPASSGRWYFFPVALGVKTPIPFLLLAALGSAGLLRRSPGRRLAAAPVLAAGTILVVAMPANLNTGLRHILPIFPMLAICAGLGLWQLWCWRWARVELVGPSLALGLGAWLVIESAAAHPDYLPYFNQLAGDHPEEVLVDSDLDWGQDLNRLADTLRARHIEHVWLTYHGKVNLSTAGLPAFTLLPPGTPEKGWIAASIYSLQLGVHGGRYNAFAWLRPYRPITMIGHSIRLYFIEP